MVDAHHKDIFSYLKILLSKQFRSFFILFLAGFFALLSLGVWQVIRLDEKTAFIQNLSEKREQEPASLEDILQAHLQNETNVEFLRVKTLGTFVPDQGFKLMGKTHDGEMGFHYVGVLRLETGGFILVDLGWLPHNKADTKLALPDQKVHIQGTILYQTSTNAFTPENDYEKKELYSLNPKDIQEKYELADLYPLMISHIVAGPQVLAGAENLSFVRKPFTLSIRNQHLGYALTWFALAIVWLLCFVFYIRSQVKKAI